MKPQEFTKESVARQLVSKHERTLAVVKEEYEKYLKLENELDTSAEKCRSERDNLNTQVHQLKEERQNNYSESKQLRKEFMTNLQKKKEMKDIPMEVLILTKQIDQLEWEIQTEAVNIDDEKKLVKQIQDSLDRLHHYANMYKEHEEVSTAVKKLTNKLHQKLNLAESKHSQMLTAVDKSDDFHKKFVDAVVRLRDARSRRIGFQRDMERHLKGIEHWKRVVDKETRATIKKKKKGEEGVKGKTEVKKTEDKEKTGEHTAVKRDEDKLDKQQVKGSDKVSEPNKSEEEKDVKKSGDSGKPDDPKQPVPDGSKKPENNTTGGEQTHGS
jgi:uncharacterized coiled-coil DUF342 family protein